MEFSWDLCEIRRCLEERARRRRWPPVALPALPTSPPRRACSTNHFPFTHSFKSVSIFNSCVCPSTPLLRFLTMGETINAPPNLFLFFLLLLFLKKCMDFSFFFLTPSPTVSRCSRPAGPIQTFKDKSEYLFSPFKC